MPNKVNGKYFKLWGKWEKNSGDPPVDFQSMKTGRKNWHVKENVLPVLTNFLA